MLGKVPLSAVLISSASLLGLGVTGALAADQNIETVVVTAQKKSEKIEQTPISVKAITGEELNEINADSAADYLRSVPSVSMTSLGTRGGNQIQIRGLGSDVANVGTITIYNDGVVSPSQNQASGAYSEEDPGLYDIQDVEVLRGPQGTLYGEGSLGGVINIKSNRPDLNDYQASASVTWFDRDHGTADNEDIKGMVNIPIISDVLAVRIVAYDDRHDGWIDQVGATPYIFNGFFGFPFLGAVAPLIKKDVNTEDVWGGRAMVTFKPNNDFDATLIFKTETQDTGGSPISSPQFVPTLNAFAGTNYNPYYTQLDLDASAGHEQTDQWILEMNYDVGFGKLTSEAGYGSVTGSTVVVNPLEGEEVTHASHAWDEELRLASDTNEDVSWIVGGYYRADDQKSNLATSGPPFALSPLSGDRESEAAVFGQAYWNFATAWTATVGARYAYQTSTVSQMYPTTFPIEKGQFHSFVPKVSVSYQADDKSMYYATISEGFRAGGANIDSSLGTDPSFVGPFRPDTVWNYELGSKNTFWDDMLTVNAAVFYLDWTNVQIDHTIISLISPPTSFITINGKNAHSFGIEGDVYFNPTPDWTITAGGDLLDARYDNGAITGVGGTVPLKGMVPAGTPKYTANLSVERRFMIMDSFNGYVRADYSLRGSSFGDVPNNLYAPPGTLASGKSQIVNLRVGISRDFWELQVFSDNLFDSHQNAYTYYNNANTVGNLFGSALDVVGVLPPRTIGVNLKLHY